MTNQQVAPVQIIVPLFNGWDKTKSMLNSLLKYTDRSSFQAILVDNGSTDQTKEGLKQFVEKFPANVRVITNKENLGFAGGINTGLSAIQNLDWKAVCWLNSDVIVTPCWLDRLMRHLEGGALPRIGAVAPVSNMAGGVQLAGDSAGKYNDEASLVDYAVQRSQAYAGQIIHAGYLVGLCALISREMFNAVGFLDERFFPGMWEDNDYFLRGTAAGFNFLVDSSTFIHHDMGSSFKENNFNQRESYVTNKKRFRTKWASIKDSPWEKVAETNYKLRNQEVVRYPETSEYAGRVKKYVVAACRVKDGGWIIERTLDRISQFADEIVILVDQFSSDNTEEILKKFPKITLIEKEPPHDYNEAWSRNRVLELAFSRNPDWVWCFDCDEIPSKTIVHEIESLTNPTNPSICLWTFPIVQLWNSDTTWRMDGLWGNFIQGRMFRSLPGQNIHNANNKIHCGSHPPIGQGAVGRSLVKIAHYGNVHADIRQKKYDWYTKTDTDGDLNMVLGNFKDYYWKLFYGQPPAGVKPQWRVIPNDETWGVPPYGSFYKRDLYRHVMDEKGLKLITFSEDNTITLTILAKSEGSELVHRALASVQQIVDEIIFVDTGTWQGEDDLAEQLGAKVYYFDWIDDFSAARNFSASKAHGDWILRIDPDEVLPREFAPGVLQLVQDKEIDGFLWPIHNYLEAPNEKGEGKWVLSETCRLYRNQPGVEFRGLVHEEIDESLADIARKKLIAKGVPEADITKETLRSEVKIQRVPYFILHFGYLRDEKFLDRKFEYYCALGEQQIQKSPEDPRSYFNTAVHYYHTQDFEKAVERYKKNIELDPENWMGWNDLGAVYHFAGNTFEAMKAFKKASSLMRGTIHPVHKQKIEQNIKLLRLKMMDMLAL